MSTTQTTVPATTDSKLQVMTIAEYAKMNGYSQIAPKVRVNINGYPFITFINPDAAQDAQANNVYFSKAAADAVMSGQPVTKELLAQHQIGITLNAAKEERVKLISNSERINLFDLL